MPNIAIYALALALVQGRIPTPPPQVLHNSGQRLEMKASVSILCPGQKLYGAEFSVLGARPAKSVQITAAGIKLNADELGKVDGWLAEAGVFDHVAIGCTMDGAVIRVSSSQKRGQNFVSIDMIFVIRDYGVSGRTIEQKSPGRA